MTQPRHCFRATITETDIRNALRCDVWQTVPEIAHRLHLTRSIYRVRIAILLCEAVTCGRLVEVRRRSRVGKGTGGGTLEYRRKA